MTEITREELERALHERQLMVQYQPKMARLTGQTDWVTTEAEALIRWRHPSRGRVSPLEFLPQAVELGLMPAIGEYVLRLTLQQLVRWRERALPLNGCVNLDASLLTDLELAGDYERIVREFGLPCDAITFEIAQPSIAGAEDECAMVLSALRRKGFRLSLDDFGAARNSLSAFGKLDFDEIKIHASLLIQARDNAITRQALAAVTGMAHALGITVCAEGVEDQATFEFLKEIQCDKMQGYFISEAVMPDIIQTAYPAVDAANALEVISEGTGMFRAQGGKAV
ncbi:MAG: EAL domain-containing protein [Pseudomonadota bacterium]